MTVRLPILLATALLFAAPSLACGSFAPRPTPTPTSQAPTATTVGVAGGEPTIEIIFTPTPVAGTPTPAATATFTPTPLPGTALTAGQPARVTAPAGLNFRDQPTTGSQLLGQFGTGILVDVLEGPVSADDFIWWRLDDRQGNIGWAAQGDDTTQWISPQLGDPQPVNRPPRVGDRAVVTMPLGGQLSVRQLPGTDAVLVQRADNGTEFSVIAGPQTVDGYNWYQIRSDDGSIEGWAADGDGADRWLSPLE